MAKTQQAGRPKSRLALQRKPRTKTGPEHRLGQKQQQVRNQPRPRLSIHSVRRLVNPTPFSLRCRLLFLRLSPSLRLNKHLWTSFRCHFPCPQNLKLQSRKHHRLSQRFQKHQRQHQPQLHLLHHLRVGLHRALQVAHRLVLHQVHRPGPHLAHQAVHRPVRHPVRHPVLQAVHLLN